MTARRDAGAGGFSLVELMMVVVIIAVLAAIAMPLYSRSRFRAYTLEATEVLGRITASQESYRATFNVYADTSNDHTLSGVANGGAGTLGTWWPALGTAAASASGFADFYPNLPASWNQLGVRPRERVRYSYQTIAGRAAVTPAVGGANPSLGYGSLPPSQQGSWFYAVASGDLDRNGVYSRFGVSNLLPGIEIARDLE